jgi:hypothetical protein
VIPQTVAVASALAATAGLFSAPFSLWIAPGATPIAFGAVPVFFTRTVAGYLLRSYFIRSQRRFRFSVDFWRCWFFNGKGVLPNGIVDRPDPSEVIAVVGDSAVVDLIEESGRVVLYVPFVFTFDGKKDDQQNQHDIDY